jgi:pimeloyl-ACP methyl ester carboxylesterase
MKKLVYCSVAAVLLFSVMVVANSYACDPDKVNWEYKGSSVSAYDPDLKHYEWETDRPPYGPFDKIALHRYIHQRHNWDADPYRPSNDTRKVLFIIPGTWDRGFPKGSNPKVSENYFFAANGYDVYTIEFRTGYIIPNLALDEFAQFGLADALKGTADWTYGVFREDIKACIELAKRLSGAHKLFLAGRSRGGTQMYIYAAKYWKPDLKGLISLDGGGAYVNVNPSGQMSQAQFQAKVAAFKANGPYLSEVSGYEQSQYAGAVPFSRTTVGGPLPATNQLNPPIPPSAPPDKSKIEFVSDLVAYGAYYAWGAGKVTNYYTPYPGGSGETFMDRQVLIDIESNFTRYWPLMQDLEGAAMANYLDNPYLDYDDTGKITLPIIFMASELTCPSGICQHLPPSYQPRTASTDITTIYLQGYGHLDVYAGTHSVQDVKQPVLEWMNDRLGRH